MGKKTLNKPSLENIEVALTGSIGGLHKDEGAEGDLRDYRHAFAIIAFYGNFYDQLDIATYLGYARSIVSYWLNERDDSQPERIVQQAPTSIKGDIRLGKAAKLAKEFASNPRDSYIKNKLIEALNNEQ